EGAGEMFNWHTGLGVAADHTSSVKYKRKRAAQLAKDIQEYKGKHPGAPVTIMGLSAGTAIVVYALEALPESYQVDGAFLLSASVSANYNLTKALRRVKNRMYVFTSTEDGVLRNFVPMVGTADRQPGSATTAGLRGFRIPANASEDTQVLYAKVVHVHWSHEMQKAGHGGGHTDVVNARFVQEYIAPLVMTAPTQPFDTATAGKVRNPDYDRWAKFAPGSWIQWTGYQSIGGRRQDMDVKAVLIEKQADKLVVEWIYAMGDDDFARPDRVQAFIETAWISPTDHPITHPQARISDLPAESIKVGGKTLRCRVQQVNVDAQFPDRGRDITLKRHRNDGIPGGLARESMKSHKGSEPFEFVCEVVKYSVAR
ncbi:MAG: hypothetical protein O7B26_08200, partial [Planctomycetota bacterium]|nr:hypothetical protein [Planctomycetota bacterium]